MKIADFIERWHNQNDPWYMQVWFFIAVLLMLIALFVFLLISTAAEARDTRRSPSPTISPYYPAPAYGAKPTDSRIPLRYSDPEPEITRRTPDDVAAELMVIGSEMNERCVRESRPDFRSLACDVRDGLVPVLAKLQYCLRDTAGAWNFTACPRPELRYKSAGER